MNPDTQLVDANVTGSELSDGATVVQVRPRAAARLYSVAVNGGALREQMRMRGLTGAELAHRAAVSSATISRTLAGRRIHPAKLRAIATALHAAEPVPGAEGLVEHDHGATDRGQGGLTIGRELVD